VNDQARQELDFDQALYRGKPSELARQLAEQVPYGFIIFGLSSTRRPAGLPSSLQRKLDGVLLSIGAGAKLDP